jgi:hypothetical protein
MDADGFVGASHRGINFGRRLNGHRLNME